MQQDKVPNPVVNHATPSQTVFGGSQFSLLTYDYLRITLFVSMPDTLPRPTDAELEILTILWSRGPSTVRDVHETIARRKPTQYTTVLKTLQIMAEKGLVRRDEKQRAHIYQAARPREWTSASLPATYCSAPLPGPRTP